MGDDPWEQLHGPHHIAKSYKNPFSDTVPGVSGKESSKPFDQDYDNIYSMEIEANLQIPNNEENKTDGVQKKSKPSTN